MEKDLRKQIIFPDFNLLKHIPIHTSARTAKFKCFTFDVPMIPSVIVRRVMINMNETFASQTTGNIDLGQYYAMLTYPNQTIQVPRGKQILLNKYDLKSVCYKFEVTVGTMEVFRRKDKYEKRCNSNWKNQDQIWDHVIEKVGCSPKHWNTQ